MFPSTLSYFASFSSSSARLTSRLMSYAVSLRFPRGGAATLSFGMPSDLNGSNASASTTHMLVVEPKIHRVEWSGAGSLPTLKCHALISHSTARCRRWNPLPRPWVSARPSCSNLHIKAPSSSSISSLLHGARIGFLTNRSSGIHSTGG